MTEELNSRTFYIFPLTNVNLFPFTTKPLHIFEPRYIEMVNRSIKSGTPIALCFVPEGTSEIRPIAGFAVPQLIERRIDQTLLVFMGGEGKVRLNLESIHTEDLVSTMTGTVISENLYLDDEVKTKYNSLNEVLVRWITQHISDPMQRNVFIKNLTGPREVIGAFAAYLVYDYDIQYEIMELTSIADQIDFLYRLLQSGRLTR